MNINEQIEAVKRKLEDRHLDTLQRRQALSIAESLEAGAALELDRLQQLKQQFDSKAQENAEAVGEQRGRWV
jgi:hypothetical protein